MELGVDLLVRLIILSLDRKWIKVLAALFPIVLQMILDLVDMRNILHKY